MKLHRNISSRGEDLDRTGYMIASKYRSLLISLGYPGNRHIYDLDEESLSRNGSDDALMLLDALAYYRKQDAMQKAIYINDVLEKKGSYAFWWYPYYGGEKEHRKDMRGVINDAKEIFRC